MDDVDYTSEQLMDDDPEPLGNDADFPPLAPVPLHLSHYDQAGEAHMVDVGEKTLTRREAVAAAFVELSPQCSRRCRKTPKAIRWR
ncbi:hypothetical protein [Tunturiibacter empetritectus]|uniref:hypothetical protein n=1 Tax=Tunturiibacter empetritectus TaxID=3069691 RepID=UPI003D9B7D48